MNIKRSRLFAAIVGFIILVISLYFLCYNIDREFYLTKNRIEEDFNEKILQAANKLEENLDPYNYLKSDFEDIHKNLFPNFPEEIIEGIPEDSFIRSLYSKETFDKLILLIKDKYSPVMVTFGNQDIEDVYVYYSRKLEEDLKKYSNDKNEKNELLKFKCIFDLGHINSKFFYAFNKNPKNYYYEKLLDELIKLKVVRRQHYFYIYKYISRFSAYFSSDILYTDYFDKQNLFSIIKSSLSTKGIHGFYSCLIPQSHIDPELILQSAISKQKANSLVNIELVNDNSETEKTNTENGLEYTMKLPTSFVSQVNAYKRLRGIDKTSIIKNKLKITASYPEDFLIFRKINIIIKLLAIIISLLYIVFIFKNNNNSYFQNVTLSGKLVFILSIILLLPILGTSFIILIISNNLREIIDFNLKKSLHNNLESIRLLDKENDLKRFSTIVEMKKILSKFDLFQELKSKPNYLSIFPYDKVPYWYHIFTTDYYILPDNGNEEMFFYDSYGKRTRSSGQTKKGIELVKIMLIKYLKNLGFYRKNKELNKEYFALTFIDKVINPKQEEKSIGQESIICRDFITFKEFETSAFFYAKDKNKNNIYLYNRNDRNHKKYRFLIPYSNENYMCFKPLNRYGDINLAITFKQKYQDSTKMEFPRDIKDRETKELISKALDYNDSGKEKINKKDRKIIQEWIFSDDSPFVVAGMAEEKDFGFFKFFITILLPIFFTYTGLLLVMLNGFISNFIKKPVFIIKKAIKQLETNNLGTIIESFSNDEFNNITCAFNEMSMALKQKEQIKRYVSERLLQSVEVNDIQQAGKGKLDKVTILSSDIRNFTGTSEKYEPTEIVEMLNSYFTIMQQAISENNGIIDKYIGDAIQAVFYDEPNKENQVIRASKAAIAMRKALKEFNEERKSKGLFTIENGIGIDTDVAITGTIGTANGRKDFSVNGDVIARSADLEAKTKKTTSKILLSKKSLEEMNSHGTSYHTLTDSLLEMICDNKNDYFQHKLHFIYKDFDDDAVELIDVRK